jgi:hypothetical protein
MERLGQSARRLLAASGVPDPGPLSAIADVWPATVGDAIARVAWPKRYARDGTLHVSTTSSTWAFELSRLAPEILGRLSTALGEAAPTSLSFATGPVPEPAAELGHAEPPPGPEISAGDRERGEQIAAGIADPELRDLVARAASASLATARDDHPFC